jgi:hypothetical protein
MAIVIAIAIATQGIPMGCAYVGFELPGMINKVRRDAFDYSRANISRCMVMLCPMRDRFCNVASARPPMCTNLYNWYC